MRPVWLNRNVAAMGATSLLNDAASEMVTPLMPVFLTVTLGAPALAYGAIEGAAEALSSLLKFWSGRRVDRAGGHAKLALFGYTLSNVARPLVALATGWPAVGILRLADRVGKGLRTAPRDALLAASAPPANRAAVFGFHRAADHAGAVLGATLAFLAVVATGGNLPMVFAWSVVPGVLTVAVMAAFVRDAPDAAPKTATPLAPPDPRTRWLLGAVGLATLGAVPEGFLMLKAGATDVPLAGLPLLWMGLHGVKSATSSVAGPIADRIGRRKVIAAGWVAHAVVLGGLALTQSLGALLFGLAAWGVRAGLTEGAERALVAELAPAAGGGSAFGWYHLVVGLTALPAGLALGGLWDSAGPSWALGAAAIATLAALAPLGMSGR